MVIATGGSNLYPLEPSTPDWWKRFFLAARLAAGLVNSFNGRTGAITLTEADVENALGYPPLTPGALWGLNFSTAGASSSFGVSAGYAADAANDFLMQLGSAYTKTTGAWSVGSAGGSLDTGSIAPGAFYSAYLIRRPDTDIVDIATSLSATAPTFGAHIPAAYTQYRRMFYLATDGSSHWVPAIQTADEFLWSVPVGDVNGVSLSTTSTLYTISVPPLTEALLNISLVAATAPTGVLVQSPLQTTQIAGAPAGNVSTEVQVAGGVAGAQIRIRTNSSRQIRAVATGSSSFYAITQGWIDARGRTG